MDDKCSCAVVPVFIVPSPLSEERACCGILLRNLEDGAICYRIGNDDKRVIDRISAFFAKLGREKTIKFMIWAKNDIEYMIAKEREDPSFGAFKNLIRPRENVIQYGAPRLVVTADPALELAEQYERAVSP